ncbi:MAG: NRDE family protein [Bacteroidota bacterium]
MCTVTFVPQGADDFILTSNRDEQASRSPKGLSTETRHGQQLLFPRDTEAGGTWIVTADTNRLVCILNGAFELHHRTPPYRKSRGLMALDYFDYPNFEPFYQNYKFDGMEPFTMVVYDQGALYDFRWDGQKSHLKALDTQEKHIWSSATLYDAPTKAKREKWFAEWQEENDSYDLDAILHFHRFAGDGDPWNDVIMNRAGLVQTVSITNVIKKGATIELLYHDLLREQRKQAELSLNPQKVGSQ